MNLDDETLLDAYLDGELDPARRLAVESALLAHSHLAHDLQELAQVRQWVGSLPRPTAPADVSAPVLAMIAVRPPAWFRHLGWRRAVGSRSFAVAAGIAVAAGLLVALVLSRHSPVAPARPKANPRLDRTHLARVEMAPRHPVGQPGPVGPVEPPEALAPEPTTGGPRQTHPIPAPAVAIDIEAERRQLADRERLATLLERPDVRRVFVVVDSLDGPSRSQVEEVLHRSPRRDRDYGRITIAQGLVVDPERPGEAIVFAVAVDSQERTRLTANLRQTFTGRVVVEPPPAPPPVVALLADTGQVDFLEEPSAAPPIPAAAEDETSAAVSAGDIPDAGPLVESSGRARPTRARGESREAGRRGNSTRTRPQRGDRSPSRPSEPAKPSTVLVWVSTH